MMAALHARLRKNQVCTRSTNPRGMGGLGRFLDTGRTEVGSHDWLERVSRSALAAWSTCRSIDSATWREYLLTSCGIEASWRRGKRQYKSGEQRAHATNSRSRRKTGRH
ncbi:cytochrome P450 alkane hydroxylase [Aspergillus luchuensis]|uniref:Cytochrome P450 alkane hydroxylase n=1 Tax=Aspergillus kawachii TaxID=1069201 RepID=A0A146FPK6_ASPKA|nr:cytochrome P450 alkane hydroxylase [Aspergillus luchuensis]